MEVSIMKKRNRTAALIFLLVLICIGVLSGCSGKMTPRKMMIAMSKNLKKVESFSNTVKADIKMEDVVRVTEVSMDMTMENMLKPKAGHAKGTASVNFRGIKLSSDMEIYQVQEGDEYVTYSSMDGNWSREASKKEKTSGLSLDSGMFQKMGEATDSFHIAEETVEVNKKECYQMYGEVTGAEIMGLLGSEMLHAYGLVEIPDEEAIMKLAIPITFDIYKEEILPARIIVDMTDVLNNLYDDYGETTDVNDFTVELGFTEYNSVGEIVVPEEVKGLLN